MNVFAISCAALLLLSWPKPCAAAPDKTPSKPKAVDANDDDLDEDVLRPRSSIVTSRELNHHSFVRSELVSWPFPSTYFGTSFGVGVFRFEVPQGIDQQGNPQSLTINAATMAPRLDLGIGFRDWVGLQISVNGAVAAGTNIDSALNFGAIFRAELGGRLVGRIWRGRLLQIGAAFGGSYSIGKTVVPRVIVNELLSAGTFTASNLLIDVKEWSLSPDLMVAFAPVSMIGFQTSFSFRFGETSIANAASISNKAIVWGVGATLDLRKLIPLALPLTYQLSADVGAEAGEASTQHLLEAGLIYSGRRNLDLGLLLSTQLRSVSSQYTGVFRMYYHW